MDNQQIQYEITTQTGKHALAGTDANVYIRIEGEQGRLDEILLSSEGKNPFEKSQRDTFVVSGKDVRPITKVSIRHDNTGKDAGWHLESVLIRNANSPEDAGQFFRCNKWLKGTECSAELSPSPVPEYLK